MHLDIDLKVGDDVGHVVAQVPEGQLPCVLGEVPRPPCLPASILACPVIQTMAGDSFTPLFNPGPFSLPLCSRTFAPDAISQMNTRY